MKHTGLTDKSGKEISEGNVVRAVFKPNGELYGVVQGNYVVMAIIQKEEIITRVKERLDAHSCKHFEVVRVSAIVGTTENGGI